MTHFLYRFAGLLAALMLSSTVHAQDIRVEGAWTRATTAGRDSASVFMYLTSKQEAILVGASSPASRTVELRTMSHKGSMMKTLILEKIALPANKRLDMTSIHGYHLTLKGLNAPLKAGETLPLTLNIETADRKNIQIEVHAEIRPPKKKR